MIAIVKDSIEYRLVLPVKLKDKLGNIDIRYYPNTGMTRVQHKSVPPSQARNKIEGDEELKMKKEIANSLKDVEMKFLIDMIFTGDIKK